jgi:hypothetical protein
MDEFYAKFALDFELRDTVLQYSSQLSLPILAKIYVRVKPQFLVCTPPVLDGLRYFSLY